MSSERQKTTTELEGLNKANKGLAAIRSDEDARRDWHPATGCYCQEDRLGVIIEYWAVRF